MSDPGSHYRREYKGIKLDPYRIGEVYGITNPIQFHMMKKLLRGTSKGHSEVELISEMRCCLDRWDEILKEDCDEISNSKNK